MRWRILALLALARLGLGFQFQALASTGEYLIADFGLDYTQLGTLIGAFMLPGLILSLPAGFAGRYLPDRTLTAMGLALLAIGGIMISVAGGFSAITVGRIVCGAGFVLSTLYLTKMVTEWFSGREIATALSILVMTWPLGIAAGQIAHEWLAANMHWSAAFQTASVWCTIGAAAVALLYRPPGPVAATGPTATGPGLSRAELILILSAALVWAIFNAGYVVYLSFAPKLLTQGGMAPLEAAAVVSLASWVMILAGIGAGQIADRLGRPDAVLYICMAIAIGALFLLPVPGMAVVSSLLFSLLGLAPAGVIMALTSQAMRPQNRAMGMGIFFSIYFLMMAPAPVIAGWLFDRSGDAMDPILFAAILFAAVAASNLAFRLLQRRIGPLAPG